MHVGIDSLLRVHDLGRRDIGLVRAVAERLAVTALAADPPDLVVERQLFLVEVEVARLAEGIRHERRGGLLGCGFAVVAAVLLTGRLCGPARDSSRPQSRTGRSPRRRPLPSFAVADGESLCFRHARLTETYVSRAGRSERPPATRRSFYCSQHVSLHVLPVLQPLVVGGQLGPSLVHGLLAVPGLRPCPARVVP